MNILSLFDGISCGRVALERAGITVNRYYASEIDKYAIQIAQKNYPNTIQLGDITNWNDWDIDWSEIDLIMGGSPCQGFSFAGKKLAFGDPRSKLFFTFVDILNCVKGHNRSVNFLFENVRMKKEYLRVITGYLGVEPVLINSALVSAQNRARYYWFDWFVREPEDKGIVLSDIIELGIVDKDKSYCIDANYYKGGKIRPASLREGKSINDSGHIATAADMKGHDIIKRVYGVGGKAPALTTMEGGHRQPKILTSETTYRKLTPIECERLQTLPDDYTAGVSNTQRYKALGNGWTVDIVAHILRGLK